MDPRIRWRLDEQVLKKTSGNSMEIKYKEILTRNGTGDSRVVHGSCITMII